MVEHEQGMPQEEIDDLLPLSENAGQETESNRESSSGAEAGPEDDAKLRARREETPENRLKSKLESLGLTQEAIAEAVPEFSELSEGKQLLVLENLQQLTLGRIQEEAQDKYKSDVGQSGWAGRIWKGVSKQWQIKKREKATAKELQQGGIKVHGTALQQLTELTGVMPEVEVQQDGKLAIGYAWEFENATHEQQEAVSAFNKVANEFARMPEEWSFSAAEKTEQQKYKAAKQAYDEARNNLLAAKKESFAGAEYAEVGAMYYVNDAEFAVRMNQFLNTHPDVERQLQSITDERAWTKAFKDIFVERSGYFTGGFIGRSVAVGTLGWAAAPIVAAGLGAWRGRSRAKETLGEREKAARKGVKDTSKEAKNIIDADRTTEKLEKQLEKTTDAVQLEEVSEKVPEKELSSLKARIEYAREKIDAGRMNYGSPEQRLQNRYLLLQAIANAESLFYEFGGNPAVKSALDERLDRFLAHKEQKITKAQAAYIKKQMLKGAAYGAGFAFAGAGIRHVGGQAVEALGLDEKFGRLASLWGRDEALETPPAELPSNEEANTPPVGPLAGEGAALRSAEAELESEPPVPPLTTEAPKTSAEVTVTLEAAKADAITDQDRIAATAKHFKFEEAKDSGLRLDMAEAAKENANLGKLEQVLDRLVAAQYVDEFGDKLDPEEAAKILNMAANLRVAFEQGDAGFMDRWSPEGGERLSALFKESLAYDVENQTLTIADQAKFEQLVDGLKAHADELAAQNKLEGAVGELPKIKQETWSEIVNAAQNKEIEVEDYTQNERVREAYEANQAREAAAAEAPKEPVASKIAESEAKPSPADAAAPAETRAPAQRELPKLLDEIQGINQNTTDPNEKALVGLYEDVRKYSEITDTEQARELAAKRFHDLEPFADQYQDVRDMYTAGLEQMLDDAVRKGEGVFHLGSPSPEKLADFSGKFGRMHGLDEQSSKIFVSWLAGEDAALDRNDFKRLGLWAGQDGVVKKNHFDAAAFSRKVKEFLGVAKSPELPQSGKWEPRTIHFTTKDGNRHEEVVNMRAIESNGSRAYEVDRIGTKQAGSIAPSSNELLQYPAEQLSRSDEGGLEIAPSEELKNLLERPVSGAEAQPAPEQTPVAPEPSTVPEPAPEAKEAIIEQGESSKLPVKEPTEENIAIDSEKGKKIAENFLSNILKEKKTKEIFGDLNLQDGINSDEEFKFLQSEYAGIFAQSVSGDDAAKTLRPHFESLIDDFIEQNKNFFAEKGVTSHKNLVPKEMLRAASEDAIVFSPEVFRQKAEEALNSKDNLPSKGLENIKEGESWRSSDGKTEYQVKVADTSARARLKTKIKDFDFVTTKIVNGKWVNIFAREVEK